MRLCKAAMLALLVHSSRHAFTGCFQRQCPAPCSPRELQYCNAGALCAVSIVVLQSKTFHITRDTHRGTPKSRGRQWLVDGGSVAHACILNCLRRTHLDIDDVHFEWSKHALWRFCVTNTPFRKVFLRPSSAVRLAKLEQTRVTHAKHHQSADHPTKDGLSASKFLVPRCGVTCSVSARNCSRPARDASRSARLAAGVRPPARIPVQMEACHTNHAASAMCQPCACSFGG